jgi:hypothetical protein
VSEFWKNWCCKDYEKCLPYLSWGRKIALMFLKHHQPNMIDIGTFTRRKPDMKWLPLKRKLTAKYSKRVSCVFFFFFFDVDQKIPTDFQLICILIKDFKRTVQRSTNRTKMEFIQGIYHSKSPLPFLQNLQKSESELQVISLVFGFYFY